MQVSWQLEAGVELAVLSGLRCPESGKCGFVFFCEQPQPAQQPPRFRTVHSLACHPSDSSI